MARQFHPEKSGSVGLTVLKSFLTAGCIKKEDNGVTTRPECTTVLAKRIIA